MPIAVPASNGTALKERTCLSRRSVLFDGHVTRYLVSLRKVCSSSRVRCSRDDLLSRCEMTRNPLPEMTCCWMLDELSTSSQMKLISLELEQTEKYD